MIQQKKWSEFLLDDGSKIRVKASVLSAIRIDGKYDDQGNPVYVLNLSPSIVTIPAEELKRKD